jgi:hypothetical protein
VPVGNGHGSGPAICVVVGAYLGPVTSTGSAPHLAVAARGPEPVAPPPSARRDHKEEAWPETSPSTS